MSAPVLGAQGNPYARSGQWQAGFSWRYQKSFRHFVGDIEQEGREEDGSQVVNHINLLDMFVKYSFNERLDLTVAVPYQMATRSQAVRNENREVIDRYVLSARGIGDMTVRTSRWMLDPGTHRKGNFSLGLGLKLPTGEDNVIDSVKVYNPTTKTTSFALQTVDQSIQPGDGGFGFFVDLYAFKIFHQDYSVYLQGTYLSNPEGTNGVQTYRSRPLEAEMSISDQYLLRLGGSAAVPWVKGLSVSFGGRWEGVPVHDLIGGSNGFRRPGYAFSLEPSVSFTHKQNTFTVSVPFAVYRNRLISVPDAAVGGHGDAAFADWLLLLGFAHSF